MARSKFLLSVGWPNLNLSCLVKKTIMTVGPGVVKNSLWLPYMGLSAYCGQALDMFSQ